MAALVARVRGHLESALAAKDLDYPWWVLPLSAGAQVTCVAIALWQREAIWPPQPILVTVLVVAVWAVCIFQLPLRPWLVRRLWLVDCPPMLAVGLWLILDPATIAPALDFAPAALLFMTLECVARDGPRPGAIVGLVSLAEVALGAVRGTLPGYAVNLVEITTGFLLGLVMYAQMRALRAERKARTSEHDRATMAERSRIAREIHDLVGHSLSVTLLHVTGARRSLAEGDDRAEVLSALEEAEDVSRRAMAEIRRSVGSLAGSTGVAPLPGAAEVARLVDNVRRAGQPVDYEVVGDVAGLDNALGLGVYRIVQESLSNVIKHAPGPPADVRVEIAPDGVVVDVRNPMPSGGADRLGQGAGIAGMAARADQLGGSLLAGPAGAEWRVRARLPLGPSPRCPVTAIKEVLPSTASTE